MATDHPVTPAAPRTPLTAEQRVLAVALISAASLVAFEITAIITALPTITDELGGDSLYGLSLAVYTLANMVAMVATAEVVDRRGPAVPFVVCLGVFTAGLIVAGVADSMVWVVVGRFLQGANGGFSPIAYSQVKRSFPADRQPMLYAFLSAAWVLPSLFAPLVAGVVTDQIGWRWVFLGMVPVGLLVGALAVRPLMHDHGDGVIRQESRVPLAAAAALGVGAFLIGAQVRLVFVAVPLSAAGIAVAWPALRRLLPRGFAVAAIGLPAVLALRFFATVTFGGVDGFLPLAAERVHDATALVQGFVIIGAAVAWSIGQWMRARQPEIDPRRAIRQGFAVMFLSVVLTSAVLSPSVPLWVIFAVWSIGGFGMGLLFNPTTVAAMSYAGDGTEGLVSGQLNLADSIGWSLVNGIGGTTVALADRTSLTLEGALGTNFAIAAAAALIGMVLSRRARTATPADR